MRLDGSVRLGTSLASMRPGFNISRASVKLKLCMLSLREQARCAAFPQKRKGLCKQGLKWRDRARGDDVGRTCETLGEILDAHGVDGRRCRRDALSLAQECRLFHVALDEMDIGARARLRARRRSRAREIRHREPRSIQVRAPGARSTSCSESAMWRVQRCATVDGAMRLVVRCHRSRSSTKRSSRSAVSRETGVSASAAARSAARSGAALDRIVATSPTHRLAVPARFAPRPLRLRCAASSVSAAGVMPSRRPAWPMVRGRSVWSFCLTSLESPRSCE